MPNIAAVLKEEIQRLARKEVRAAVGPLKKRVTELSRTNADLKRKVPQLEKTVARLNEEAKARQLQAVQKGGKAAAGTRVGPRSIAAQRKRLKLTREQFGQVAGVSSNTVYLWETGQVDPKEKSRAAIVSLRRLGVRDAKRLLEAAAPKKKVVTMKKVAGKKKTGRPKGKSRRKSKPRKK